VPADEAPERWAAIERAVRALARRDHSAAELAAKLARSGVSEAVRADAVETLERVGYVDDRRFACDRAARLAERGYGDAWIRADLEARGVTSEAVEAALAAVEPEGERAVRTAAKAGDAARSARLLARRGFSDDVIECVLSRAVAQDRSEAVGYEGCI
jgi:regulatory protein